MINFEKRFFFLSKRTKGVNFSEMVNVVKNGYIMLDKWINVGSLLLPEPYIKLVYTFIVTAALTGKCFFTNWLMEFHTNYCQH